MEVVAQMTKNIGIVLFPDFEDLDAIGPREALTMMAKGSGGEWEVALVSEEGGPVQSFLGTRYLVDYSYDSCPPLDVILVPGGLGTRREMANQKLLDFVRKQGARSQYVASVCTGAMILHRAGFLEGKRATTHWGAIPELQGLGGNTTVVNDQRWVHDGNVITAAGVSAGIDMALALTDRVHGRQLAEALQLAIEYDPQPPFDAGSPVKADASTLRLAMRILLGDRPVANATKFLRQAVGARVDRGRRALAARRAS
jgi:transcriptional regulator GlxA family with amidase domain